MIIYRFLKTNVITQRFGESSACCKLDSNGNAIRPFIIQTKINNTCPVGYGDFYTNALRMKGHNGSADIKCYRGEPVYFNVYISNMKWYAKTEVDEDGGVGLRVYSLYPVKFQEQDLPKEISNNVRFHWNQNGGYLYVQFLFWHLKDVVLSGKPKIQTGTFADGRPQYASEIKLGDLIAYGNNTGASSGDHVHFAMKFCQKNTMTIGYDNGYTGAVSTTQWEDFDTFVGDIMEVYRQQMQLVELLKELYKLLQAYLASKR